MLFFKKRKRKRKKGVCVCVRFIEGQERKEVFIKAEIS